jgi:hypothetical protein
MQAEALVAGGTGNSNLREFIRGCVHSHPLATSSFSEPVNSGVKARDRIYCYRVTGRGRFGV